MILINLHFNDSFLISKNFSQPHGLNFSVETSFKGEISYCSPDHDIVNTHVVSAVITTVGEVDNRENNIPTNTQYAK